MYPRLPKEWGPEHGPARDVLRFITEMERLGAILSEVYDV
jgi:hypothetical protein